LIADFLDAHKRHWDDAETLYQAGRWANADHLYGIGAECGLKRLMIAFGMPVSPATGSPTSLSDRIHANGIWARFESYRNGNPAAAAYVLPAPTPFVNWDVSDRYANQSHFNRPRAQAHQAGAKAVRQLVKQAQIAGLI
jgi:hypothetical protein